MVRGFISLFSFFFLILLTIVLVGSMTEARPFNILKADRACFVGNKEVFGVWSLGSIKQSGPSPGQGNKFTDSRTLGDNKAGPSPGGKGH